VHGIILALVIGKPVGITAGAWLATRAGLASGPEGYSWRQLIGGATLCGIGFTMPIFIASSAFQQDGDLALAKASAMVASLIAGLAGWLLLRSGGDTEKDEEAEADASSEDGKGQPASH
jgi:NhaA family Na+:H+ antiporter